MFKQIILDGNLVVDPYVNEKGGVTLRLAVNHMFKDGKKETDFYLVHGNSVILKKCESYELKKGDRVQISGLPRYKSEEKKDLYYKDGTAAKVYDNSFYIVAQDVVKLAYPKSPAKSNDEEKVESVSAEKASAPAPTVSQPAPNNAPKETVSIPGFAEALSAEEIDPDLAEF